MNEPKEYFHTLRINERGNHGISSFSECKNKFIIGRYLNFKVLQGRCAIRTFIKKHIKNEKKKHLEINDFSYPKDKNHEKCKQGRFKQRLGRKLVSRMHNIMQKVSALFTFWTRLATTRLIWGAISDPLDFEGGAEITPFSKKST